MCNPFIKAWPNNQSGRWTLASGMSKASHNKKFNIPLLNMDTHRYQDKLLWYLASYSFTSLGFIPSLDKLFVHLTWLYCIVGQVIHSPHLAMFHCFFAYQCSTILKQVAYCKRDCPYITFNIVFFGG